MSDRHSELLRQRALVREHLAWLDAEIAAVTGTVRSTEPARSGARPAPVPLTAAPASDPAPHSISPPAAVVPALAASRSAAVPSLPPAAEAILEEYRVAPGTLHQNVRKGCFLYFAAALVLLGLGVVALYFAISSR